MAMETVQAVRQAEIEAALKEKEAAKQSELIILDAEKKAEAILSSMKKTSHERAEQNLLEANVKAKEFMDIALRDAQNEIISIKEMVKMKEKEAVSLVLSEII